MVDIETSVFQLVETIQEAPQSFDLLRRSASAPKIDLHDAMSVDRTDKEFSHLGFGELRLSEALRNLVEGSVSKVFADSIGQHLLLELMVQEFTLGERRYVVWFLANDSEHAQRHQAVDESF